MVLLIFAVLGIALGYRFHTTRSGYALLAAIALLFPIAQIGLVVLVRDRNAQTMLPLVLGLTVVFSMLAGVGARAYFARR